MSTVNDYFQQAQLSLAAYALDLTTGISGKSYTDALQGAGMTPEQAIAFANQYTVVDQYTDPVSGFSGTVFQDASGQVYMAMRGTEPFTGADWSTNIADVGADGIAIDQGIAMYNWYQRLITPAGQSAVQYVYHPEVYHMASLNPQFPTVQTPVLDSPAWLEQTTTLVPNLADGGLVGVSNVISTGHSLGGHLAMMMSRIAPGLVSSVSTFNAPGFDMLLPKKEFPLTTQGFFDLLRQAELSTSGLTTSVGASWDTSIMSNFRVSADIVSQIGTLPGGSASGVGPSQVPVM